MDTANRQTRPVGDGPPAGEGAVGEETGVLARLNRVPVGRLLWIMGIIELAVLLIERVVTNHWLLDMEVYRLGAAAVLEGHPLYGTLPDTRVGINLPFTYPPFAALLFVPFALAGQLISSVVISAAGALGLFAVLRWVLRGAGIGGAPSVRVAAVLTPALTLLEPVRETLNFGQVNLVLMVMVAADCLLARTRWPRGLLVGLAAGIKLTPAVFALYFLLRRDWKAFGVAAGTGLATLLVSAAVVPADSWRYWTHTLINSARIGSPSYASNQSLKGVLARLDLAPLPSSVLLGVLGAGVLGLALVAMYRLLGAKDSGAPVRGYAAVLALLVNAALGLLLSPVSWSHHWVWAAAALPLLLFWAGGSRWRWLVTVVAWLAFAIGTHWLVPVRDEAELAWSWWQHIVGDGYVIAAVAMIAVLAIRSWPPRYHGRA